ncbi:uncharacterized [Tachysurus ichikawai]
MVSVKKCQDSGKYVVMVTDYDQQEQIQSVPGLHRHFIPATCSTWSAGATVNHVTISSPGHPDPSRAVADRGHDETRGDSSKHGGAGKWSPVLTSFVSSMPH